MAKIRPAFQAILCLCILFGAFAAPGRTRAQEGQAPVTQLTQVEPVNTDWQINQVIPDTYQLVAENATFQLYGNPVSLGFKVVDKRSGYVWHSSLDEKESGDRLNKTWTAFASSGISIDFLDTQAVGKRASITNSEPAIDFQPVESGFEATVTFKEPSITLKVAVKLEESGVSVDFPFESIQEADPNFKLGVLYVYPFFGATRVNSVPGYMLIPDGAGSLIRFSKETKAKNMFYGRYYGADLGMIAMLPFDPYTNPAFKLSVPVFGMVHGYKQHAFIVVTEKGAPYGELQVHPAGVITNFNFLNNTFVYNQSYFQATNRSGAGVTTLQQKTNAFDVKMHYRFLTGDDSDYVGMARSYQQYLVEKGALKKVSDPNSEIGIRLEFLGAEKEKVLLWNRSITMTTVDQLQAMLKDLGIKHKEVIYFGWQPYGAASMPPKTVKLDRNLGDLDQLRAVINEIKAEGGNFYLYLNPQAALWEESGYSPRNDLAMAITDVNIIGYNRQMVNYYFNLDALSKRYQGVSSTAKSGLNAGLALDGISSTLYSDFKANHLLNREQAIQAYQQILAGGNPALAFYNPNDYLFRFMQAYYDIPISNSGYIYTTDLIPFLQIVFAGYLPTYGPALNFSSDMRQDLLRQIDFGVYPSYFLTNDVTAKILNTRSNWIFSSSYEQWSQEIKQTYQWMNSLLAPVKGQAITARQVLQEGVVAVTYANGKQIIVNYTGQPYTANGLTVGPQDAAIVEAQP